MAVKVIRTGCQHHRHRPDPHRADDERRLAT